MSPSSSSFLPAAISSLRLSAEPAREEDEPETQDDARRDPTTHHDDLSSVYGMHRSSLMG